MGAELPRPGVEVIQQFKSVSPTVVTPTLVPCVVGVCRQVVDVLTTSASGASVLNSEALVPLPASFVAAAAPGSPAKYTGLDGLKLVVSLNHSPSVTVTFSGNSLSPAQVVSQVNTQFATAGVGSTIASVVGTAAWRLRTLASGQFQTIEVLTGGSNTSPAVLTAFGLGPKVYSGADGYDQHEITISKASFPDPRSNLAQLSIEDTSTRLFLFLGGASPQLKEIRRTETFLRNGFATAAQTIGSVDLSTLTYGGSATVNTKTILFKINGGSVQTVTFVTPADVAALLAQINAVFGALATATRRTSDSHLVLTTAAIGPTASIEITGGSALTDLGLVVGTSTGVTAAAAIDDGNGDAVTPLIQFPGQNFSASATAAQVTGTATITSVTDGQTLTLDDGLSTQTVTFSGAISPATILTQINAVFSPANGGQITASVDGTPHLILTSAPLGRDGRIRIVNGTALTALGLAASTTYGGAYPAAAGDALYIDGVLFANIVQVAPGAVVTTLKIDKQVPINASLGLSFFIQAKNLVSPPISGRPFPDLTVDVTGTPLVKLDLLRDTTGAPVPTAKANLYLAYHAIRQDVTPLAKTPGLLRFNDPTQVTNSLAPLSTLNPLALGFYFALLNSPGTQVTGIGVDAISADSPFGTVEAFTRSAVYLEAFEVYAIAPLTHDSTVAQVFNTHVNVMSEPGNKGERICIFNPSLPTTHLDTLVASGTDGNSTGSAAQFDTGVQNLGALLLGQGLDPTTPFTVADGLFLDIASDNHKYSILSVSGSVVTVKTTGFSTGENDDSFYSTTTIPVNLIEEAFAVRIRGAALTLVDGTPNKDGMADTLSAQAQTFLNRRFWQIVPDQAAATLGGLEQVVDGFYMCAAIAGMIGQQPPQQSFTNFPMSGFTRVIGSNDFFSDHQMNRMAAGGCYIIVQDAQGAPLISRMALTTDLTSIETRTDSITKVVDFTAKFLRRGLKNFIGRFNITQGFLDSLGHVIQGLLGFLAETGVLIGSHLNNIIQDANAPDTVLVDITLDVPFPCNYIRLTLVV